VKRNFVGVLAGLIVITLLGVSVIGTAQEDTWTRKADMPTARAISSTSWVNEKIYAIGGAMLVGGLQVPLAIVEEYNPTTDTWRKKADMPTARFWLSTSVVNGKIYAIGGAINLNTAVSTVEVYDPATDVWAPKADMPTPRDNLSTRIFGGKIYAIGGYSDEKGDVMSIVEEYDTGFRPSQSINPAGKLTMVWGAIKQF